MQLLVRSQLKTMPQCKLSHLRLPPSLTEDGSVVRIVLVKSERDAANCWRSLLEDAYEADPSPWRDSKEK